MAGQGLSEETWGWEKSCLLMYFYCGEGRVRLGRRESPELQLCWGWEEAAKLNGGLMLESFSWEGLCLEWKGCSAGAETEPKASVRAEGKRKPSRMGLESITQCKLSAGDRLLLQGVFSLWTERGSCFWLIMGLALKS